MTSDPDPAATPCDALAAQVLKLAQTCRLTIATAESCTAGRLAACLANSPGAGKLFHGGFITYTKEMKTAALGVDAELLRRKGAVCEEVAAALALGALERTPADIAAAITGVAGPEPDEDGNPVGLVFCAGAKRGGAQRVIRLMCGSAEKEEIVTAAMRQALLILEGLCDPAERADA